jgi:inorganic pyrophosphatase
MSLEAWLDGYDQRKNDLLAWCREGGDAVAGAAGLFAGLEKALKEIRQKVQADAAAADLARMDELLGGPSESAPAPESVIDLGVSAPVAPAAPEPAAPGDTRARRRPRPDPPTPAPTPTPVPAMASATAEPARPAPAGAAEGILKSLQWMDSHSPEPGPAPSARSRTSSMPAALQMFGDASGAAPAVAQPPVAPATPVPVAPPAPPSEPVVETPPAPRAPSIFDTPAATDAPATPTEPVLGSEETQALDSAFPDFLEPSPKPLAEAAPEPAPAAPAAQESLLSFDAPPAPVAPAPATPEPTAAPAPATPIPEAPMSADLEALAETFAPATEPEPVAPTRKRKPIVIACPEGEKRRAALADVGPGPEVPFLLHAVIEVPRGGGTGYVYNDTEDVFVVVDHPTAEKVPALSHVAYGFIPDTVSDDGAHLDAFLLSSGATGPGELLRVRALGYLRRGDGDHKLFCVPEKHGARAMADIPETVLRACEAWENPTGVTGGTWCDGEKARELLRRSAS